MNGATICGVKGCKSTPAGGTNGRHDGFRNHRNKRKKIKAKDKLPTADSPRWYKISWAHRHGIAIPKKKKV